MKRSAESIMLDYCTGVMERRIVTCKLTQQAVKRHLRDLKDGGQRGMRFDAKAAQHAIDFFSLLKHSKGEWAGKPLILEPWQVFKVGSIFGWLRADGYRRFRTVYEEVARKNGKTLMLAGAGLYGMTCDGEQGAEIYSAATKHDQAVIAHTDAVRMVKASPSLKKVVKIFKNNLNVELTNSKYVPLGADADTLDGLNVHFALVDEVHAHKTRNLWDVLETATGSRRQPLIWAITTAGFQRESICRELRQYAIRVLEGVFDDDSFFSVIYTLDEKDEWDDEKNWSKANPNLGVSVKLDDMRRLALKAKESPASLNNFLRKRLNIWTEQDVRWLAMAKWDLCGDAFNPNVLDGEVCFAGLDLSTTTDITALVLYFPESNATLCKFWIPEDNAELRERRDRVPYLTWAKQGHITRTPGNVVDYTFVRAQINELAKKYELQLIGYDPWNARHLAQQLKDEDGLPMVEFRQGYVSMNEPCKALEALVIGEKLRHGGNPVLRWMASNVTVATDPAGNIKMDKGRSTERIDGMVALAMAIGCSMSEEAVGASVYETRGIIRL